MPSSAVLRRAVDSAAVGAPVAAPAGAGEIWLVAADGRWHPMRDGLTIGRAPDQLWRIDDTSVSARHATVRQGTDGVEITDEGSTNGTWVNGVRIQAPRHLTPGDVVVIGSTRWSVAVAPPRSAAAPLLPASLPRVGTPADHRAPSSAALPAVAYVAPAFAEPSLEVAGRWLRLDAHVTKLGRDPSLAVVVDDPKVSRVHAQIERTADGDYVRDLDSMNRTWINDQAQPLSTPYRLKDGDVIRLGTTVRLVYHAGRRPDVGGG